MVRPSRRAGVPVVEAAARTGLAPGRKVYDPDLNKAIAQATGLSPHTVRTYLREAYLRLGVSNRVALGRALGDATPPHLRRGERADAG